MERSHLTLLANRVAATVDTALEAGAVGVNLEDSGVVGESLLLP